MITNPAEYKVGLYIRLSDEDDGIETQSESVVNQQKILNEFARRETIDFISFLPLSLSHLIIRPAEFPEAGSRH